MRFIERRRREVRDGGAAARVQCDQEDKASSPLVQGLCEQRRLVERYPGQVDLTSVHTNTRTQTETHSCKCQKGTCMVDRHGDTHAHVQTAPYTRQAHLILTAPHLQRLSQRPPGSEGRLTFPNTPRSFVLPWTRAPPPGFLVCPQTG